MIVLETERLQLRQFTLADAPFVIELFNTPKWVQFIGERNVKTIEEAERYLTENYLKSYQQNGFGFYVVEQKTDQKTVGMAGLIKRETLENVDIGYAFLPEYEGKGYATEAAEAVLKYVDNVLKIKDIVAIVNPENEASKAVLAKIGMRMREIILFDSQKELLLFER